ncbi:MAG: hypothetical protein ABH828_03305 [archaeon]
MSNKKMNVLLLKEGLRVFKRNLKVRKTGFKEYSGNAENICKQIINDCYNNKENYFMTSTGHFRQFWTRDFGLCIKPLKELGYQKKIISTLDYALNIFKKNKGITTTISPEGKAIDVSTYAPDSLAYILYSLIVANDKKLLKKYESFLKKEVKIFFEIVVDKKSGLVKRKHFSSMKDLSIRKSSCYDNTMVAWVSVSLDKLGIENPLKKYDYKKIIFEFFWTKEGFIDDLSGSNIISGDANVVPYFTGLFNSKRMINISIKSMQKRKLDNPFPLKYTLERPKFIWFEIFNRDYEHQSIWPHMGLQYIEVVSKVNKKLAGDYLKKYSEMIVKHKTFPEVYTSNGKIYKNLLYHCDEGMLWAAMHLSLSKRLL